MVYLEKMIKQAQLLEIVVAVKLLQTIQLENMRKETK